MPTPWNRLLSLSFLALLLVCGTAGAEDLLKSRARWEWSLPDSKEKVTNGTFTCWVSGGVTLGPGKTEKDRTHIGQWSSPAPNEVHLVIEMGRLKGIIRVKKTKAQPPTYTGEFVHRDGKKERIVLQLFKD